MAWNEPSGNNKDPWGHRKNEQGPPDLEEIIKKLQAKLNGLFGGGQGGQSPSNGGEKTGDSASWAAVGIFIIIALIVWSLFGFYVVQPAEQGVETRFGRYTQTTLQGLNWHIPFPVEEVQKVNVEQVRAFNHKAQMLTRDENIVNVELVVQYRVSNTKDYLFNVADPDKTLHHATESALREVVGSTTMERVLTVDRDRVALDTKQLLQAILDRYQTGLNITSVNMQNAQPPEAVQAAFADVIKAREDEERDKNRAQAYSNEVIQRAGGESERLRQEAQAYKAQVVARAEGETQRFISILTEYEKAPEVTRQRLYLETMESILSNSNKVMMDSANNGNNNVMVLPLDKLLGGTSMSVTPAVAVPSLTAPQINTLPSPPEESRHQSVGGDARARGGR